MESRAGWVVSNPMYDETLRRCPRLDCSLPGWGWLHDVYYGRQRELTVLPSALAELKRRHADWRSQQFPQPSNAAPAPAPQGDLFEQACTEGISG